MGLIQLTAQAYARMMAKLLPPGTIWRLDADGRLHQVFLACGDECERVGGRAADLLRESDPRTADELLPDFERVLGLEAEGTADERRARVVALLVRRQRVRPSDFKQALGPLLGQDSGDVALIEISRAEAAAMDDDRAIYRFYVYRDPSVAGAYDLAGAQAVIDGMEPAHTEGKVIESVRFTCGDPYSICGRDLLAPDPVV